MTVDVSSSLTIIGSIITAPVIAVNKQKPASITIIITTTAETRRISRQSSTLNRTYQKICLRVRTAAWLTDVSSQEAQKSRRSHRVWICLCRSRISLNWILDVKSKYTLNLLGAFYPFSTLETCVCVCSSFLCISSDVCACLSLSPSSMCSETHVRTQCVHPTTITPAAIVQSQFSRCNYSQAVCGSLNMMKCWTRCSDSR